MRACITCLVERDEDEFSPRHNQCKSCLQTKERERQMKKTDLHIMYDKLLWIRSRRKLEGFIELSDVKLLWQLTNGNSVISGKKAHSMIVIDVASPISIHNIAPVTKHESMSLALRRKSAKRPFPADAMKKLKDLLSSSKEISTSI